MNSITKKQEQRNLLLRALYHATDGSTKIGANYVKLGVELGLSAEEAKATMQYLVNVSRLAQYTSMESGCMTGDGVVEVERQKASEEEQETSRRISPRVVAEVAEAFARVYKDTEIDA